jgi:hypothetical protein
MHLVRKFTQSRVNAVAGDRHRMQPSGHTFRVIYKFFLSSVRGDSLFLDLFKNVFNLNDCIQ